MDTTVPGTTQPAVISTMPAGLPAGLPMTLGDDTLSGLGVSTPTTPAPASAIPQTVAPGADGQVLVQTTSAPMPSAWYVPPGFGDNVMKMNSVEIYVVIIAIALTIISASLVVALSKS